MPRKTHPRDALFAGEKLFPVIPSCEHFAGSERLITKAIEIQNEKGGIFDITMDLEDGSPEGKEKEHAEMVVSLLKSPLNQHRMSGVRIHDPASRFWRQDLEILLKGASGPLTYLTIPKPTSAGQVREVISSIQEIAKNAGLKKEIPIHVLIETHGALRDVFEIASLPWVQVLDFGLMDFISGHFGAIPQSAMRSPGQFEHPLVVRAKTTMVAAALANGVVPAHNVTLDLKDPEKTKSDARRARTDFGFLRMWSIYPTQIDAITGAMLPDFSEVEKGCRILLAAQAADWGPIQFEGELHDRATYRYFWQLLQQARLSGQKLPEEAEGAFF